MRLKDLIKKYGEKEISTEQEQAITKQLGIRTVWKPTPGETYWYLTDTGILGKAEWRPTISDELRYKLSNCYRTADDAEIAYQKLLVTTELKRFMEEHNEEAIDWEYLPQLKWYLYYNYNEEKVWFDFYATNKSNTIYFTSEKIAEQAIEEIGEDRLKKYYFEVGPNMENDDVEIVMNKKDIDKIKVVSADVIVTKSKNTALKPYYKIKYKPIFSNEYNIGFGSYCLDFVWAWLQTHFEIVGEDNE